MFVVVFMPGRRVHTGGDKTHGLEERTDTELRFCRGRESYSQPRVRARAQKTAARTKKRQGGRLVWLIDYTVVSRRHLLMPCKISTTNTAVTNSSATTNWSGVGGLAKRFSSGRHVPRIRETASSMRASLCETTNRLENNKCPIRVRPPRPFFRLTYGEKRHLFGSSLGRRACSAYARRAGGAPRARKSNNMRTDGQWRRGTAQARGR